MIHFEKFDEEANAVLNAGVQNAEKMGSTYVGTEHLLYGILCCGQSVSAEILRRQCGSLKKLTDWMLDGETIGARTALSFDQFSPRARRLLQLAVMMGTRRTGAAVTSAQLIAAMLEDPDSAAMTYLQLCGVDCAALRKTLQNTVSVRAESAAEKRPHSPFWNKYGRDLTQAAQNGELAPVIGRDAEMARVLCILGRKTKNNPCLIGAAGVGKTAIVEGIAQKIADRKAPPFLLNKTIIALDMAALVAGTKYRGDFEDRMRTLIDEARKDDRILLFMDELHMIVGTGAAEGSIDAANLLKPALARGDFRLIGATTSSEYHKCIENDGALDRRFQTVMVEEPDRAATERILFGLRPSLEQFHRVIIDDSAISAAVQYAERYLPARMFPDKALDLLDEACSFVRTLPESASGVPPIGEKQIADLLRRSMGIEFSGADRSLRAQLLQLPEQLSEQVIGQAEAIRALSDTLLCASGRIDAAVRPLGSFLFTGPSGMGKTKLARALAAALFGNERQLLRFDMSEFMESMGVSALIGAAPGYVGYGEGGRLTEAVRHKPYCVLLLDEFEKAHPDVQNLFLQILDEGRVTDAQGRKVSFANVVLIMTSNAGCTGRSIGFFDAARSNADALHGWFAPELLNRIDCIIPFRRLTEDDYQCIAAMQLKAFANAYVQKNTSLTFDPTVARWIGHCCAEKGEGARAIARIIRDELELPLMRMQLAGDMPPQLSARISDEKIVLVPEPVQALTLPA